MKTYDAIVIGSGQAGNPLARRLAGKGWTVLVVERDQPGGSCINYGCTPTKTMIASAKAAYQARRGSEFGVVIPGEITVDLEAVVARKNRIVEESRTGTAKSLKLPGIDYLHGEASFTGPKEIRVRTVEGSDRDFSASYVFINAGTSTTIPDIDGLDTVPYLTSSTILDLVDIPDHLLIIGGSYIALEFGQMFRRFGSEVTIIAREDRFLAREDADVAEAVREILEAEGIRIHTGANTSRIDTGADGAITMTVAIGERNKTITGTHLLLAAGRSPNTGALGLELAGVPKDEHGFIIVDEKLETPAPGIYALGDVKGGPAFTHISYNDYLVVCKNLLHGAQETIRNRIVPYCMYIDPELGRVGLNEDQAKKAGLNYRVAKLEMSHVARGRETGETQGFMKAIVDADTKKILGVTILGAQGGEIMSVLQLAMQAGLSYEMLRENIFAHPSYSESINNLFMTLDND
jgi:pyruvate/2-oxoglutarate dehydrogenase complex dihydrolipoamide dehydrogenase (E3) component